jgi:hypothetical protein
VSKEKGEEEDRMGIAVTLHKVKQKFIDLIKNDSAKRSVTCYKYKHYKCLSNYGSTALC